MGVAVADSDWSAGTNPAIAVSNNAAVGDSGPHSPGKRGETEFILVKTFITLQFIYLSVICSVLPSTSCLCDMRNEPSGLPPSAIDLMKVCSGDVRSVSITRSPPG